MPDDAPLPPLYPLLGGFGAEVLVMAAGLFGARIEHDEVMDDFQEAGFGAQTHQDGVEGIVADGRVGAGQVFAGFGIGFGVVGGVFFFPGEVVLFGGFDSAVAQALGVVTGHHQLNGGEEGLDELFFLVVEVLADAFFDGDAALFQFQHTEGDAVDIEHDVGPFVVGAFDGDFFGNGEVVVVGVLPVDQGYGLGLLARPGFDFDPIAELAVDGFVGIVKAIAIAQDGGQVKFPQGFGNQSIADALAGEPLAEQVRLDVAIVGAGFPVAEVGVPQMGLKQLDDTILGNAFPLADGAHGGVSSLGFRRQIPC